MTNPAESVETILAEMRDRTIPEQCGDDIERAAFLAIAARLAAAHAREVGEAFQKYVDANEARVDAIARAEAADALLREGVGGFGRVLIQTNDNAAVLDWRKRASAHLSGAAMQSRVPVGGEG